MTEEHFWEKLLSDTTTPKGGRLEYEDRQQNDPGALL